MRWFILFYFILAISGCSSKSSSVLDQNQKKIEDTAENKTVEDINFIAPTDYIIGPTDGLEVLYHTDYNINEYIIDTEDKLQVNFQYYPDLNRTVKVRPDGFITLARIGEVKAAGERPLQLAENISKLYSAELLRPAITVEVLEFDSKISRLRDVVRASFLGQFKYALVRPDGKISLPYLKEDVLAAGKTALALSKELKLLYSKFINNVDVTVSVSEAKSYQTCIIGDVRNAGCYTLSGANTLLQAVSRAGGFTNEANLRQILIIRRDKKGHPTTIISNAEDIIYKKNIDAVIQQYDVIYVPRSWLSEASLKAKTIWQLIPVLFTATIYQPSFKD